MRAASAEYRAQLILKGVELVKKEIGELATTLTKEQGKPLREAALEILRYAHTIEYYAGLGKNIRGGYIPQIDENKYGLIIKRPLGVVGAIVPWNFPVSLMGNKIGPALLAGNTMVIKPAETTPLTVFPFKTGCDCAAAAFMYPAWSRLMSR